MTRVWVTEAVVASLTAAAREAAPEEIGGIALGVERDGEPWITGVVAFAFAKRSANSFVIPAGVTPAVVDELRREDDRLGYLGDWHSHPLNAEASNRDRKTLRSVAARRELETRPAVLLVVRAVGERWEIDALVDDGRTMRKATLGLTGPLP